LWLLLGLCRPVEAQTYDTNGIVVQTFAGSGFSGWFDGIGAQTMFKEPGAVVADSQGNLFVLDSGNMRVRKIATDGTVTTVAGGGTGFLPGKGTNIMLNFPLKAMAIDRSNNLWVTAYDCCPPYFLRVGSDAQITKVQPISNGIFSGVCVDSGGNVYVTDSAGNRIYRYRTNSVWEVFAGSGNGGSEDGNGIFTSFNGPAVLASDQADNIYVWDSGSYLIRRISQGGDVVTIAGRTGGFGESDGVGTNASFKNVAGMCVDVSGNLILADGTSIRKISAATNVTTMAGSFTQSGYTNGPGNLARFNAASGVFFSRGRLFIADSGNHRIRSLTFNPDPQPVSGGILELATYPGLKISGAVGRTYRVESSSNMEAWSMETTILLNQTPYLWIDQNSLGQKKFYRAVLLP
jgi:hypothetical protein